MRKYFVILILIVIFETGCSHMHRGEIVISSELKDYQFLKKMLTDDYYPKQLVEEGVLILRNLCHEIEIKKPESIEELYMLTHEATNSFNDLAEKFEEKGSDFETMAREYVAHEFMLIARTYGYEDADIEELIATRDW